MKEIITMWKYSMMVALTALCAGIYMLFLLPTKTITLIPGITEIRPASLLPVIFGLLFGPAGAWGSAIGNLAGDLFGTFSPGSIFGFAGNFLYAYIPYKLWHHMKQRHGEDRAPTINTPWKLANFGIVSFISSMACAVTIAWGLNLLNLTNFPAPAIIIVLNNTVTTLLLGPILLPVLYKAAKKYKLLWTDLMHPKDFSKPSTDKLYPFMIITGSAGALMSGLASACFIAGNNIFDWQISVQGTGSITVTLFVLPFLAVMLYGSLRA
ncbi:MAG: QueT transporter family protein [Clostridiaceae bacterium]|jgi:energy-coupling factor transport system substrate-specific component|nr:QueT transporter family protein [Clostridiaceae bacterium]